MLKKRWRKMALLEVKGITKKFGGLIAVNDLDLQVDQGEIVGMIGPNGAGKTTAFNMISGVYKPNSGQILFKGNDVTHWRPDQICKLGLTRTFQVVKPFNQLTVRENVIVGAYNHIKDENLAHKKVDEVLEFLDMSDQGDQMASDLTIASRKRLELARALATDPTMLLLDEVMAGLRPKETDEVIDMVRRISEKGVAVLLVEHVMYVVMALAKRVVVLHHGKKIAEGVPADIVRNKAVIEAYLGEVEIDVAN
jgi:branched-chain amino acid transport system ATP-binding protein